MIAEPACSLEAVLLSKRDCLLCHEAEAMLKDLATEFPLVITVIDAEGPQGSELMQRFLLLFTPALVLGGEPFGYGRLSRRTLHKAIETRLAQATRDSTPGTFGRREASGAGKIRQTLRHVLSRSV
jgi:hypothetical protein